MDYNKRGVRLMDLKIYSRLNEELGSLSSEELETIIHKAYEKLAEEFGFLIMATSEYEEIVNIVKLCVHYGVVNKLKTSAPINRLDSKEEQLIAYTAVWLKKLVRNRSNSLLERTAKPLSERDVVRDPALKAFLTHYYKVNDAEINSEEIDLSIDNHDLLMSIENIQGHLLEAYIASKICSAPFNFIWLDGEIVKAADFALEYNKSETEKALYLLQIKNKYNTENSSSVTVRQGTTVEIKKWYRLGKKTLKGVRYPVYKWDELNEIIYELCGTKSDMNETDYIEFLKSVIENNPKIINI